MNTRLAKRLKKTIIKTRKKRTKRFAASYPRSFLSRSRTSFCFSSETTVCGIFSSFSKGICSGTRRCLGRQWRRQQQQAPPHLCELEQGLAERGRGLLQEGWQRRQQQRWGRRLLKARQGSGQGGSVLKWQRHFHL